MTRLHTHTHTPMQGNLIVLHRYSVETPSIIIIVLLYFSTVVVTLLLLRRARNYDVPVAQGKYLYTRSHRVSLNRVH